MPEQRPANSPSPMGFTHDAFLIAAREAGVPRERASEAYKAFHRDGRCGAPSWAATPTRVLTTDSPEGPVRKFLLRVAGHALPSERPHVTSDAEAPTRSGPRVSGTGSSDSPRELETESVIIPMRRRHETTHTLCVSSQVGCAMGCTFCETAQMGLVRSLMPVEIVAQWWAARHALGAEIRNIVFMGMGEPLDNLDHVLDAIRILRDDRGPAVGVRRITISTVGRLDGLARLREIVRRPGWKQLNLAVSINAPNDEIRSRIMPINRAMPLRELVRAMEDWPLRSSGAICAEYVLIPGMNDADAHADELCALLRNVRCCVNVIPYNPRRESPWPAPSEADVARFLARLESNGQFCKRRRTKGRDTMAACGQLGNEAIRRRRFVEVTTA